MEKSDKRREDRRLHRKGLFIVIDGLDGVGKGEVERAIIGYEQKKQKAVLDSVAFSRAHRKGLPDLKDFWNPPEVFYHTISTAEPSYAGIGQNVREEITANSDRKYSSTSQIQGYSLDRLIQMKKVVIPALENGVNVVQARSCAATLCYQTATAKEEGKKMSKVIKYILEQEGNKLQLKYAPDLLIIPTIKDVGELEERLKLRSQNSKDDNSIFEKDIKFQERIKPYFESSWLRKIFTDAGSKVAYLNAGLSERETKNQTLEIYKYFLENKEVSKKYSSPKKLFS